MGDTRCHGGVRRQAGPGYLPLCRGSLGRLCRGLTHSRHPSQCWAAPSSRDAELTQCGAARFAKHQNARCDKPLIAKYAKSNTSKGTVTARYAKFSASSFDRDSKSEDAKHRPSSVSEFCDKCVDRYSINSRRGDEDRVYQLVG